MWNPDLLRNSRGGILVYTAIIIIALLAMAAIALDTGQMYIAKQRAQNVCDASALAGVWMLAVKQNDIPTAKTNAINAAGTCASGNNQQSPHWQVLNPTTNTAGVQVTFPSGTVHNDAGTAITVTDGQVIRTEGIINVNFAFAGIIGYPSQTVRASSKASIQAASSVTSNLFAPLSVSDLTIFGSGTTPGVTFGQQSVLKVTSWQSGFLGAGNFGPVVLPGMTTGGSSYRDTLAGTVNIPISITAVPSIWVPTDPGNKQGPTKQGIDDRLKTAGQQDSRFADNSTAWSNWLASYDSSTGMFAETSRIMLVPILKDPQLGDNGRTSVEIVGYAGFFIEDYDSNDNVIGRFIQGVQCGDTIRWLFPTGDTPDTTQLISNIMIIS